MGVEVVCSTTFDRHFYFTLSPYKEQLGLSNFIALRLPVTEALNLNSQQKLKSQSSGGPHTTIRTARGIGPYDMVYIWGDCKKGGIWYAGIVRKVVYGMKDCKKGGIWYELIVIRGVKWHAGIVRNGVKWYEMIVRKGVKWYAGIVRKGFNGMQGL